VFPLSQKVNAATTGLMLKTKKGVCMECSLENMVTELSAIRKENGISLLEISRRMKTSHSHAWRLDKGVTTPLLSTVMRYAKSLGYTITLSLEKDRV
jgi:predicted transcriptional regulator